MHAPPGPHNGSPQPRFCKLPANITILALLRAALIFLFNSLFHSTLHSLAEAGPSIRTFSVISSCPTIIEKPHRFFLEGGGEGLKNYCLLKKVIICYRCDTSTTKSSHIALFHHGWTNNVLIVELHALRVTLLSPTLLQHWKSNSLLDDDNCCYNWSTLVRSSSSWYWWWLVKMVTDGPACGEQSQGSEVSFCHFERRAASDEITAWPTPSHHIWCVMYLMFHILHWSIIIRRQIHKSSWPRCTHVKLCFAFRWWFYLSL